MWFKNCTLLKRKDGIVQLTAEIEDLANRVYAEDVEFLVKEQLKEMIVQEVYEKIKDEVIEGLDLEYVKEVVKDASKQHFKESLFSPPFS